MTITNRSERDREESDESSDEQLVDAARAGDTAAYATLWERHEGAARRAARAITSAFDPDDVVSEAFASVLSAIQRGGGPTDAFRPYLFATIRNVAAMWGRKGRPLALDTLPDHVLADGAGDPFESMSERSTIAHVFKSLPARHRTLLWYLEVEGMKPREIAPLMGLTPNAVSALSYRAREGFRQAWLESHIAEPGRPEECRWFCERVVVQGKRTLARSDIARFNAHLRTCRGCQIVAADIENVSRRLRAIVLPLILGGTAATAYLADAGSVPASAASWTMTDPGGDSGIPVVTHRANEGTTILGGTTAPVVETGKHVGAGVAVAATLTTAAVVAAGALLITVTSAFSVIPPVEASMPSSAAQAAAAPSATPTAPSATAPSTTDGTPTTTSPGGRRTEEPIAPSVADAVHEPSPPASAPAPGPRPTPKPTPTTTPPAEPPFRFTQSIVSGATVPDVVKGSGIPGAWVSIRDEDDVVLFETTIAEDGTFVADVSGTLLHQGMSIHAFQTVAATGRVQAALVMGPLTFAEPVLSPGAHAAEFEYESVYDDSEERWSCGRIPITVTGEPGAWVEIVVDDHDIQIVQLEDGVHEGFVSAAHRPDHRVSLRYVDPITGRSGLSVDHEIVLSDSGSFGESAPEAPAPPTGLPPAGLSSTEQPPSQQQSAGQESAGLEPAAQEATGPEPAAPPAAQPTEPPPAAQPAEQPAVDADVDTAPSTPTAAP
ncbi:RNA polymerase sigma factor [Microbacterium sp. SSM24]|uniref:RNA polymerase sigma factor n=1 Tax=Microbacterium sp. SSM24 TaxID=2991714 RepID=UPI002226CAC6|nr:sigma-70 family RNA polymerase sigma factor [Microbacterium sp. SSM24]MCW3493393.1 sigma-70 family RNA polymerase sigma factor [Microbacterium sp. SSM24]